jgi:hypothetical protein
MPFPLLYRCLMVASAVVASTFALPGRAPDPGQVLKHFLGSMSPEERTNIVYIDAGRRTAAIPSTLSVDLWNPPASLPRKHVAHTGESFTLRRVPDRPVGPLLLAPSDESMLYEVLGAFESEFGAASGPYRRVLSRLPTKKRPGYAWFSARVHLPGAIDIREADDDTACIYCGGWGGHQGAIDAGFVHSRARHDWAFFIRREIPNAKGNQPTGETFSFKTRFKEGQDVKLTLSVPQDDLVAVTASGIDEHGDPVTRTVVVAMNHVFAWRADGKANILKRITTIAQDHEDFSRNEEVVGVHWFSPNGPEGPCRIGQSWKKNHDWGLDDTANDLPLAVYETWPATYRGKKVVFVERVGPGEETDGIVLAGAKRPAP